jgi:hypothetical protein
MAPSPGDSLSRRERESQKPLQLCSLALWERGWGEGSKIRVSLYRGTLLAGAEAPAYFQSPRWGSNGLRPRGTIESSPVIYCRGINLPGLGLSLFYASWFPIICTTSDLVLDLLSKSRKTTCCHVPRHSLPSTMGMLNEGFISAARTWEKPFPSPQRRL